MNFNDPFASVPFSSIVYVATLYLEPKSLAPLNTYVYSSAIPRLGCPKKLNNEMIPGTSGIFRDTTLLVAGDDTVTLHLIREPQRAYASNSRKCNNPMAMI